MIVRSDQQWPELPGKVFPLNLANQFGVAAGEIHEYLIKKAGDPVEKDEVLAENKPFIKWLKTEIRSPFLNRCRWSQGKCSYVSLRRVLQLLAYVDGTIIETIPQYIVVETTCALVQLPLRHRWRDLRLKSRWL